MFFGGGHEKNLDARGGGHQKFWDTRGGARKKSGRKNDSLKSSSSDEGAAVTTLLEL